jgi:hypothetical protein
MTLNMTLIGGPTVLIEAGGFRMVTAFPDAVIVPAHRDGWAQLTQSGDDIERAFTALDLRSRLQMLVPGVATAIDLAT